MAKVCQESLNFLQAVKLYCWEWTITGHHKGEAWLMR